MCWSLPVKQWNMEQEIKKWNIIYPVYINSKKTIAEGRRISASKACENPTCMEISDCCGHLKIPHAVEVNSTIIYFVLFFRFYYTSRCLVVVLATGLGFYREVGPICFKIRALRFNICVRQLQFSCARCLFGMQGASIIVIWDSCKNDLNSLDFPLMLTNLYYYYYYFYHPNITVERFQMLWNTIAHWYYIFFLSS